jgi:hypothetical protein
VKLLKRWAPKGRVKSRVFCHDIGVSVEEKRATAP